MKQTVKSHHGVWIIEMSVLGCMASIVAPRGGLIVEMSSTGATPRRTIEKEADFNRFMSLLPPLTYYSLYQTSVMSLDTRCYVIKYSTRPGL